MLSVLKLPILMQSQMQNTKAKKNVIVENTCSSSYPNIKLKLN